MCKKDFAAAAHGLGSNVLLHDAGHVRPTKDTVKPTPELVARLMSVVVFERQRLSRFCHDIGMVNIKHKYQTSPGLYAQSTKLAKGRKDLVRA